MDDGTGPSSTLMGLDSTPAPELRPRLYSRLGLCAIGLMMLWIGWPLLGGQMPLSADHTVHLARSTVLCEALAEGHLRSWSEIWAFGLPLGELYPPLGDYLHCGLWTIAARLPGVELGPQHAYAWLIFVVLSLQAYAGFSLGQSLAEKSLRPAASAFVGVIAAVFLTWDVGYYREGGWIYTVTFGVWPQALATALAWIACMQDRAWLQGPLPPPPRVWLKSALWGAAAFLAHPIALPQILLCGALLVFAMAAQPRSRPFLHHIPILGIITFGLAAFWWIPMLEHREFMANYGWLHRSSKALIHMLAQGEFCQWMIPTLGFAALIGIGISVASTSAWPRVVSATVLVLWGLSSRDVFWDLRLDRLSSAFTHLQYQRFLIGAKPAIYALSALAMVMVFLLVGRTGISLYKRITPRDHCLTPLWVDALRAILSILVLSGFMYQLSQDRELSLQRAEKWSLGEFQLDRFPDDPERDADYLELIDWARSLHNTSGTKRFWFVAPRNSHWFMDFSARSGHHLYKSGFTPGDNFRHRPESSSSAVINALGIDYRVEIRKSPRAPLGYEEEQRFGDIRVFKPSPRETSRDQNEGYPQPRAWDQAGDDHSQAVELRHNNRHQWSVRIPELSQELTVQLPLAHYSRWTLEYQAGSQPDDAQPSKPDLGETTAQGSSDDSSKLSSEHSSNEVPSETIPTFATPIIRPEIPSSLFRDPERALGNDGKSPNLLTFRASQAGIYRLSYQAWNTKDRLAALYSIIAALFLLRLGLESCYPSRFSPLAIRLAHTPLPARVNVIALSVFWVGVGVWAFLKVQGTAAAEQHSLMQWHTEHASPGQLRCKAGPFKANMKIRPALITHPRAHKPANCLIFGYPMPETLRLWFAVEDDDAKRRLPKHPRHRIEIWIREALSATKNDGSAQSKALDPESSFQQLEEQNFSHRPDRHFIELESSSWSGRRVDLKIVVTSEAEKGAWIGLNAEPVDKPTDLEKSAP